MTTLSQGAIHATIEGHCLYVEERPETFSEHFKAAVKMFAGNIEKGAQLISQNCGIASESVTKWVNGEATPDYDATKDVCIFMRHHIAR